MGQNNASEHHAEMSVMQSSFVHQIVHHCMGARATVQKVEDLLIRTQVVAKLSKLQNP